MSNDSRENLRIAQQAQQKFAFYWVGLTFAILGLALQTTNLQGGPVTIVTEVAARLVLLVTGVLWLVYLEGIAPQYIQFAAKAAVKATLEAMLSGYPAQPQDIEKVRQQLEHVDERVRTLGQISMLKYRFFKWTFVVGVFLLLIARSYGPMSGLVSGADKQAPDQTAAADTTAAP